MRRTRELIGLFKANQAGNASTETQPRTSQTETWTPPLKITISQVALSEPEAGVWDGMGICHSEILLLVLCSTRQLGMRVTGWTFVEQ